jgi:hypothetical protein
MGEREEQIRARLEAATQGRWGIYHTSGPGPWEVHCGGITVGVVDSAFDAQMIADAPSDLAYLLDRVAELEVALAVRSATPTPTGIWMAPASEVKAANAELAERSNQLVEATNQLTAEREARVRVVAALRAAADFPWFGARPNFREAADLVERGGT